MKLHRLYLILALTASMTLRSGAQTDDLAPMSEEFSTSGALANFQRLYQTEGWGADQLVSAEIEPGEGRLVMIPRASSWYQDYKGPLAYKTVSGDFVATTDVSVRNNAGTGAPGVPYSFGGLLIRAPRPDVDSPGSWLPGREDWVIHAVGTAGSVGVPAYEEKTTDASVTLPSFPGGSERAVVRIARIGQAVVLLRRPNGGEWTVARRYRRADLPATLQVGLTAYGNFDAVSAVSPLVHNQTVLAGASADLVARFDYFRLRRPLVPAALQGLDMADAAVVSDTQLLSFLAEPAPEPPVENDDITRLDDEFEDASSITNWSRVYQAEGWGFDQLERWEVNQIDPGRMTMIPHASSWYQEWRGVQAYKAVTGDFVVTTDVEPTSRSGTGAPNVNYSLAGIMVRRPRPEITAGRVDWTPNGENYIFLSMGAASDPGTPQFEVKTTLNSDSNLEVSPGGARARLQIARVGQVFIVLRQIDNQPWQVHRRYTRADLPETLHVGLTTYTDWDTCNAVGHEFHNTNLLVGSVAVPGGGNRPAQPDLIARFDYVRFRRPAVPSGLQGRNLASPSEVSDAELLGFLAAHANQRGSGTNEPAVAPSIVSQPVSLSVNHGGNAVFALEVAGTAPIYYQWLRSGTNLIAETNSILTVTGVGGGDAGGYSVVVTNAAGSVTSAVATLTVVVAETPVDEDAGRGFPNVAQTPGRLLTPLLAPGQGRTAVIAWHNGQLYSFPEQPSSQPGSDFIVRRWDLSDLGNIRAVEELGLTPHPVMAHGFLFLGSNLVAGFNGETDATSWSFRAGAPGVNQRVATAGLQGVFNRGHLYQPWHVSPTYWSYSGNTQQDDVVLSYDGETLSTFDHLRLSGGVIGHPFIVGNILIFASDQSRTGVTTYDISDPGNPVLLDNLKTGGAGGYWPELWGGDGRLFVVFPYRTGGNGMRVVEVTDPANLRFVADVPLPGDECMYIQFQDEYAFMGSHKVDMRTMRSVLTFNAAGQRSDTVDVDTSQFLLPIGNLLVTGGSGPYQGMAVWAHQAEPDLRGPSVAYHIPRAGQANYPVRAPISLLIHETLRSQTIQFGSNLIVRPLGGDPITARWTLAFDDTLTISPDQALAENTTYEVVVVGGGIRDAAGNGIEAYSFTFSTGDSVGGNRAPLITSLAASDYPLAPAQPMTLSAVAVDPEGDPLEFRFDFGDGSPRTDWGTNSSVSHAYAEAGHYPTKVQVRDASLGVATRSLNVTVLGGASSGVQSTRGTPIALHAASREVWVANPDNDTVASINADTLARGAERAVGGDPRNIAFDAQGNVWVTCHDADRIDVINGAGVASVDLGYGSAPFGIVMSPDAGTAYVSQAGAGRIVRLDTASRAVTGSLDLGPTPRALALNADGTRLYVTRFVSPKDHAEVWEVDAGSFTLRRVIRIKKYGGDPHRNTTAEGMGTPNYLSGLAFSRDGSLLMITANKMNTDGGTATGSDIDDDNTVRNIFIFVDLSTGLEVRTIDIDNSDSASAVALSPHGDYFYAALQGNNELVVFDALNAANDAGLGGFIARRAVGSAPQGIAVDPVTQRVFVKNLMSRDVSVLEMAELQTSGGLNIDETRVATVASEAMPETVRRGKEVFYHAGDRRMSGEGYISCASCHVDGGHDGRVWDFTGRGEGLRNTITLHGRAGTGHGNVHWSANFDEIQDFEHDIRNAFGGTGFLATEQFAATGRTLGRTKAGLNSDLDALAAYVASLGDSSIPRSPHRASDGTLTPDAQAGAQIFASQNCRECHAGSDMTDGRQHDVGTLRPTSGGRLRGTLRGIDTPGLRGLWDTAPYFHDGSAPTLADVFTVAGGALYPAEFATPAGAAGVIEGQNHFINYDETAFGAAAMEINGVGSMTFTNVDGGSGGIGAIELRYSAAYISQNAVVRVNGNDHPVFLPLPFNQPAWRRVTWLTHRLENVLLQAGSANTITIDLPSGGAMGIDHIVVSTPENLARAVAHRRVLALPETERGSLMAYLAQLDGSPIDNGPAAPPFAQIDIPAAATRGEMLRDDTVEFVVSFNRPVTGFDADDLDVGGTAGAGSVNVTELKPGVTYLVEFTGMVRGGSLSLGIIAGAVNDGDGQSNPAIPSVAVNWQPFIDDLAALGDEFDNAESREAWMRVNATEGWQADQLRTWSVNTDRAGHMRLEPHTAIWTENYRAPLAYKLVTGDFVATVRLDVRRAAGQAGWPTGNYSMGGLMVRAPRTNTRSAPMPAAAGEVTLPWPPAGFSTDWTPGGEDWLAVFLGRAWNYAPNQWTCSVSNTDDSNSDAYNTTAGIPEGVGTVTFQITRVGSTFLILRRHGDGPWIAEQRLERADLPATLQVGIAATGDFGNLFGNAALYSPGRAEIAYHNNRNVISSENGFASAPDVSVDADYFRLLRVRENLTSTLLRSIPVTAGNVALRHLAGSALAEILGDRANSTPGAPVFDARPESIVAVAGADLRLSLAASGSHPIEYQWLRNGLPIEGATTSELRLSGIGRAHAGSYVLGATNAAGGMISPPITVRVLVPKRLHLPIRLAEGHMRISFGENDDAPLDATDAANVEVWFSDALGSSSWTRLTNAIRMIDGRLEIDDTGSLGQTSRFYRVIER